MNAINFYGNEAQMKVASYWYDRESADILFSGAHASGKAYLSIALVLSDAATYPETRYFIATKQMSDHFKFTRMTVEEVRSAMNISYLVYDADAQLYRLSNGSLVYLLSAEDDESDPLFYRFSRLKVTRGVILDAHRFASYEKDSLWASVGRWNNDLYSLAPKLLMTCRPSVNNFLYVDFYLANLKGQLLDKRRFVQGLPSDNKMISEDYLHHLKMSLSERDYREVMLGEWVLDEDDLIETN